MLPCPPVDRPAPHHLSRDDCRRSLRRLELEAYSAVTSAMRAQGRLTEERRAALSSLRTVLHISQDRHAAEARRAATDPLLAVIAERLIGPNADLDWTREGRRKVPILPRGVPQTMYAALADEAARYAIEENEKIAATAETAISDGAAGEETDGCRIEAAEGRVEKGARPRTRPAVVLSDRSSEMIAEEGPPRKKSRADSSTPRGRPSQQRFLNLSQVYSNYSKTSGKASSRRVESPRGRATKPSKANRGPAVEAVGKHRPSQGRQGKHSTPSGRARFRDAIDPASDPRAAVPRSPLDAKSQPTGFQANFARSLAKATDDPDATAPIDSPIARPSTRTSANRESNASMSSDDSANLDGRDSLLGGVRSSKTQPAPGKPTHLIIKKKSDGPEGVSAETPVGNVRILSKSSDLSDLKVLQNRRLLVASPNGASPKLLNSGGKLITTKMVQQIPQKSQAQIDAAGAPKPPSGSPLMEKVLIVSKSPATSGQTSILQRSLGDAPKNIIISNRGAIGSAVKGDAVGKATERDFAKNVTLNSGAKTILVNPKGHKMVVLPSKPRPKGQLIGQPVFVKSIQGKPSTMKFIPVGNQGGQPKLSPSPKSSMASLPRLLPKESKAFNQSGGNDSPGEKSVNVQIYPKSSQPLVKSNAKGNVIVVQKGNNIAKAAITIAKNGSDLSKVVMSNKIINSNMPADVAVNSAQSNLNAKIVCDTVGIDVKSEGMSMGSDLPEFLEGESATTALTPSEPSGKQAITTEDAPVIFARQIADACNADSLETTVESVMDAIHGEEPAKSNDSFAIRQIDEAMLLAGESPDIMQKQQIVSDWGIDSGASRQKVPNEVEELRLTLDVSSGSDVDEYLTSTKIKRKENESHRDAGISDETSESNVGPSTNKTDKISGETLSKNSARYIARDVQDKNLNPSSVHLKMNPEQYLDFKSNSHRADLFNAADINMDSYDYMDDGMSAEEMFPLTKKGQSAFASDKAIHHTIDHDLVQLLNEDHVASTRSIMESSQTSSGAME